MNRLFYILILLALIPACSSSPVMRQLTAAEELMTDHPDSALAMLRNIDTTAISAKSERALYALLLSQALDKNYIDLKSDSIISFASEYYAYTDDQYHNMLAQYYLGRVNYNACDYPHSLVAMFKAHDIAKELNLNFWIAMTARGIADVYGETYNAADAVVFAEIALQNMKNFGENIYIINATVDLIQAYHNNADYSKSISLAHNVLDSLIGYNDNELYAHTLRLLGKSYFGCSNYDKSIDCFNQLSKTSYIQTHDSAFLGLAYLRKSDKATALNIFNALSDHKGTLPEWLQSEINRHSGNTKEALEALTQMYNTTNELLKIRIRQQLSTSVVDYYSLDKIKQQNRLYKTRFTLYSLIIFGLILFASIFSLMYRHQKRQTEIINQNIAIANEMREILSIKDSKYASAQESILQLLNSKFDIIDNLCQLYYESKSSNLLRTRLSTAVTEIIEELSSDKKIEELESYVNTHINNVMAEFRKDLPNLKKADYSLFLYLILGFSINAIALFLKESKITSIYERKRRLKNKIKQLDKPHADKYLHLLN